MEHMELYNIDDVLDEYENQTTLNFEDLAINDHYITFSGHLVRVIQVWESSNFEPTNGRIHDLTNGIFGHFTLSWLKEKATPETHPQYFL